MRYTVFVAIRESQDNVHSTGLDVIDDSAGTFQNFPYLWEFDFRDNAAGSGEGAGLLGASGDKTNVPRVS